MNILVTGGLGYIGCHTTVELLQNGHSVIIADDLRNSKIGVLDKLTVITGAQLPFYQIDVTDENQLKPIFCSHKIDGVIHFAGLKAVAESIVQPLEYYYNNLVSTITLSKLCLHYEVSKFVFSSSATVYGNQQSPLQEELELGNTTNPYGTTKSMSERILGDVAKANPSFAVSLLRYFNPIGAHESGLIGEDPNDLPNNLMPYITKVAKGELERLYIFGNDYDTLDGTGVRDYIHVADLAKGHVKAIEKLEPGVQIYNLGTGRGTSVLELIQTFQDVNGVEVPYVIVDRRPGDLGTCFADPTKAKRELNWQAEHDLADMVRDAWYFELNNS